MGLIGKTEEILRNFNKRLFDILLSSLGLVCFFWLISLLWLMASVSTRSNGFFMQSRIGRYGKAFRLVKIKTMLDPSSKTSTITAIESSQITRMGALIRRFKLDELPQLWNVLLGQMSFVGPRPDVPGYADKLIGEDRLILRLRPGITGPASIKYKNEEELLKAVEDPQKYNDEVIWPDKVQINLEYYKGHSLHGDIVYIMQTIGLCKPRNH